MKKQVKEYSREEMVSTLHQYFKKQFKNVYEYEKVFGVRVPLYCTTGKARESGNEIIIEVVTTKDISSNDFFRTIFIEEVLERHKTGYKIENANPLYFYRYYFPWARVYYALADYAIDPLSHEFRDFEKTCQKNNIGLIKVFNPIDKAIAEKVEIISKTPPLTLMEEFTERINSLIKANTKTSERVQGEIKAHLERVLDYLVFYPAPEYQRRAIIGRFGPKISLFLLNEVQNLKHVEYQKGLSTLSLDYRDQKISDYKIAYGWVQWLWEAYLGIAYPNPETQEKFEELFLRDFTYREHFVHQFQVFLLGSAIIDKLYDSTRRNILDEFRKDFKVPFERAWLVAATYHDYNYSTQKYNSWHLQYLIDVLQMNNAEVQDKLSQLNLDIAAVRENFLQTAKDIIDVLCNNIDYIDKDTLNSDNFKETLDLFLYEKIVTEKNHALTSAVTLFKIYKKTPKIFVSRTGPPGFPREAIEQAALAISLHDEGMWEYFCGCKGCLLRLVPPTCANCRERNMLYGKCKEYEEKFKEMAILKFVKFEKHPLLYLLLLCDSCQDQGRGNLQSQIVESIIDNLEVDQDGKIVITLVAKDKDSYEKKLAEFDRLKEFLKDGKFEIILKLEDFKKEKKFIF